MTEVGGGMHWADEATAALASDVFQFVRRRITADAAPGGLAIGRPLSPAEFAVALGPSITDDGLGGPEVLRRFAEVLERACLSVDHSRFLAFVPSAPTEIAILGDIATSACSIYAGSWLEGSGAVWAENEVLRWVADLAGMPDTAGGCFVSGGTIGNLSALVAARDAAARRVPRPGRWVIVSGAAHSSVATAASVMDADLVVVPGDRLTGGALAPTLAQYAGRVAAVVATAGTTNLGLVDDLDTVAAACVDAGVWLHVDGAYGGAALLADSVRDRFAGIERADSLIIDPHKWLFGPFDACALVYRDPEAARLAHAQHASYLEVLTDSGDWNPSDYAVHLSRRARGLPLWFSLAAHGTRAYRAAVEQCLATARAAAAMVNAAEHLELVREPELSIVAFRRRGWAEDDYRAWSERLLRDGTAFIVPSADADGPMLRICIVNPRTTTDDIAAILTTLA